MEGNPSLDQPDSRRKKSLRQKRTPKLTKTKVSKKKNTKMGGDKGKRKDAPGGADGQKQKKKKTGNAGKWTTPNQANKLALERNSVPQAGDRGIWVTCARHQENKAAREVINLFEEYIERMYGIKSVSKEDATKKDDDDGDNAKLDIAAAIAKELGEMKEKKTADVQKQEDDKALLKAMKLNIDCLLFVRTRNPIEPVEFVKRIVVDTKQCTDIRKIKCRYLNRLTPMSVMGKATEQGLSETARQVLEEYFDLSGQKSSEKTEEGGAQETEEKKDKEAEKEYEPYTYAIRPTIRNHSNLKRDVVINTIAGLINDERHKVNLTNPDKVILVDIFQTVCGMSVVDGDWDELKKYNMTELYNQAAGITTVGQQKKGDSKQQEKQKKPESESEPAKEVKESVAKRNDEEAKDTKEKEKEEPVSATAA